tara:strand:- start:3683 stop:4690 length:1008 start_codon:yes stop_codon:yes gene_type:complete
MLKKTIFIAEAGVNHDGSLRKAKQLIDAASYAGADYVKFQTYKVENLITIDAPKANYQTTNTKSKISQYLMLKKLQLSYSDHYILIKHAKKKGIKFLSSAFDIESLNFLYKLELDYIKIPSGEINNVPYLEVIGKFNKKTILSTGMSTIADINNAIKILVKSGLSKRKLIILQCNTEYPSPISDANINSMLAFKKKFKTRVGYSDHTLGNEAIYAAVALGAEMIEKHFTLDKRQRGPDHSSSASVDELKNIIETSKKIKISLGSNLKKPTLSEIKNIEVVRKKIVASQDIHKGDIFTKENLTCLRSKKGVSAINWNKYIGKKSKKNYKKNQAILD